MTARGLAAPGPRSVRSGTFPLDPQAAVVTAKLRRPAITAMRRERLLELLAAVWDHRLALIVAPPGCGKTTLLTQLAAGVDDAVAWCRPGPGDAEPRALLGHLHAAVAAAVGGVDGPWHEAADAVYALQRIEGTRVLLVLDDLHLLWRTPGEAVIERLVDEAPPHVAVVAASRAEPGMNLSRLRVGGLLLEVRADNLRFRSWEVERLFRELYGEPLGPEEVAELARRTEGWAAGLQLFHLATRGKPAEDRRRTLAALSTRSRLVREYLARNVLDGLDERLRGFLLRTAVLGRMTGELCDQLLGGTGGAAILAELERRQLFTYAIGDDGWYRYHEMLRSHLESIVLEEMGEAAMRQQRRRAGRLLERAGAFDEALEAYCRAEDWASAGRLLGLRGEGLVANPGWWVDLVPASLIEDDPWVRLAVARRHRASGRWHSAVDAYRRAEAVFTGAGAERMCQRERIAVACWTGTSPVPGAGWSGALRSATQRDPLAVCEHATAASSHQDLLVAALAALLAGDARIASHRLAPLAGSPPLSRAERLTARLATAVAALLAGDPAPLTIWEEIADEAESAQLPWLAGLARAGTGALRGQPPAPAAAGVREDAWGTALLTLLSGWCAAGRGGGDPDELDRAAGTLELLAAPVLEVWARALAGLIRARQSPASARSSVRRTEARARALRVPGARALALLALAELEPAARHLEAARSISDRCGLALPCLSRTGPRGAPAPSSVRAAAPLAVATFGGFILQRGGRRVDLRAARPKVRSLLRLLAINSQRPLHREVIVEALWPEADPVAGTHSLQVAVSSLRGVLDGAGIDARIGRDADAYRLILPPATLIDTVVFEQSAASARAQRAAGEDRRALRDLVRALAIYRGELLPEEGPAEWVVAERDRYRAIAHDVALGLATLHHDRGDSVLAVAACEQGLRIDRYRDDLWRLLIAVHDRAGDGAAAARARRRYLDVLAELDVADLTPSSAPR